MSSRAVSTLHGFPFAFILALSEAKGKNLDPRLFWEVKNALH
jgi:hypothetical protein